MALRLRVLRVGQEPGGVALLECQELSIERRAEPSWVDGVVPLRRLRRQLLPQDLDVALPIDAHRDVAPLGDESALVDAAVPAVAEPRAPAVATESSTSKRMSPGETARTHALESPGVKVARESTAESVCPVRAR